MKKIRTFDERLYDPKLGAGVSSTEILQQYVGQGDYFISFTEKNKVGINPQSKYETPLGIYTYPLDSFYRMYVEPQLRYDELGIKRKVGSFAPFAGQSSFVNLVEYVGSEKSVIRDIGVSYSSRQYEEDTEKLQKIYVDTLIRLSKGNVPVEKFIDGFEKTVETAEGEAYNKTDGGYFWNLTRTIANFFATILQGRPPVQWNKIFRDLGYQLIVDESSKGIIHPGEPMQAVFFERKALKVIDRIRNEEGSEDGKAFTNPNSARWDIKEFIQWLKLCRDNGYGVGVRNDAKEVAKQIMAGINIYSSSAVAYLVDLMIYEIVAFEDKIIDDNERGLTDIDPRATTTQCLRPLLMQMQSLIDGGKTPLSEMKLTTFINWWNQSVRDIGFSSLMLSL